MVGEGGGGGGEGISVDSQRMLSMQNAGGGYSMRIEVAGIGGWGNPPGTRELGRAGRAMGRLAWKCGTRWRHQKEEPWKDLDAEEHLK